MFRFGLTHDFLFEIIFSYFLVFLYIYGLNKRNTTQQKMGDDSPIIYGLELQSRALCSQQAETDAIRFLVGTQSLRSDNQVHLIDFDEETNIVNKYVFLHSVGEIWDIDASPSDKQMLATCYNTVQDSSRVQMKASVWRIPPLDELEPPMSYEINQSDSYSQHDPLRHVTDLDAGHGDVKSVVWNPSDDSYKMLTVSERHIDIWSCYNDIKLADSIQLEGKAQLQFNVGKFNPHHGGFQIATGVDSSIKGYDLRNLQPCFTIENAHNQIIRDLDFNPNKQYYLASCSDDCKVKYWDTRNTSEPLMIRVDHSHWVWSVCYNNFHDQLVLTSSSDSRVILSNLASLSSEPYGHLDDPEDGGKINNVPEEDRVIAHFDEHEDSVYSVVWSSADPWVFASLSFDGRLVINRVPRAEKYKILL